MKAILRHVVRLGVALMITASAWAGAFAPLAPAAPVNAKLADLGRHLFFDTRLSNDGSRSCARCHDPRRGWGDAAALSKGYTNTDYYRNAPSLINVDQRARYLWDGRGESGLEQVVRVMIARPDMMHADLRLVAERLKRVPEYVALWRAAAGPGTPFAEQSIVTALAEFLKTVRSHGAPIDRYLAGDTKALSGAAEQGLHLFLGKAGCARCHSGPLLSDGGLHRTGVPQNSAIWAQPLRAITMLRAYSVAGLPQPMKEREDVGRYAVSKDAADRGRFLTPGLRDLKYSAPYMHNGVFRTLREVVDFYDRGGGPGSELQPLRLTEREKRALVAFLASLSGEAVLVPEPGQPLMRPRVFASRPLQGGAFVPVSAQAAVLQDYPPLAPLPPVPVPADNPLTPEKIALGKLLFWDPRVGGNGSTPCVSCHFPQLGWGDGNAISRGYPGTQNLRNAQTALNAAYYRRPFWEGAVDRLEAQAQAAGTGVVEGNADPSIVEMRLRFVPDYVERFRRVFGTEWPQMDDAWRAIASFVRTVVTDSGKVPFDRYARGDKQALSPAALRGYELFKGKAGCIRCHNGPLASDQQYHAVGVPENDMLRSSVLHQVTHSFAQHAKGVTDPHYAGADVDLGRYYQTKDAADLGKFRTPSLRELKYTAPYMHNGSLHTLEEVVEFFDRGGGPGPNKSPLLQPLGLSTGEKGDLVAFLEALSMDEPLLVEAPRLPGMKGIR